MGCADIESPIPILAFLPFFHIFGTLSLLFDSDMRVTKNFCQGVIKTLHCSLACHPSHDQELAS